MRAGSDIYTHGHAESVLRSQVWRTVDNSAAYLAAHLRAGLAVLDVGCGPGTITVDLARRVAPGRVVGVDAAAEPLQQARASLPRQRPATPSSSWETGTPSTQLTTRSTSFMPTRCCSTSATLDLPRSDAARAPGGLGGLTAGPQTSPYEWWRLHDEYAG